MKNRIVIQVWFEICVRKLTDRIKHTTRKPGKCICMCGHVTITSTKNEYVVRRVLMFYKAVHKLDLCGNKFRGC